MGIRVTSFGWNQLPGAAIDIAAGANGALWVIGTNPVSGGFGIFRWNGSDWDSVDGGGVRIAVGPDGTPWVVSDTGGIFVLAEGGWQQLPGAATDIGIGANGAVWVIGTNPVSGGFGIFRWNGSDWDSVDGGGVRIAVGPDGTPWVVSDTGGIFVLAEGGWQQLPGAATDIAISRDAGGTPWVIGTTPVPGGFDIFYWMNNTEWASLPGGAVNLTINGFPSIVDDAGTIFASQGSKVGG